MSSFGHKELKSLLCQYYDDLNPDIGDLRRLWPVPSVVLGDKIQAKKYRRNLGFQLLMKLVQESYNHLLDKAVDAEQDVLQRSVDLEDLDPTKPDFVPETCAMGLTEDEGEISDEYESSVIIPETQVVEQLQKRTKKVKKVTPPKVASKKQSFKDVLPDCHDIFEIEQEESPSLFKSKKKIKSELNKSDSKISKEKKVEKVSSEEESPSLFHRKSKIKTEPEKPKFVFKKIEEQPDEPFKFEEPVSPVKKVKSIEIIDQNSPSNSSRTKNPKKTETKDDLDDFVPEENTKKNKMSSNRKVKPPKNKFGMEVEDITNSQLARVQSLKQGSISGFLKNQVEKPRKSLKDKEDEELALAIERSKKEQNVLEKSKKEQNRNFFDTCYEEDENNVNFVNSKKKEDRALLKGFSCRDCEKYYAEANLNTEQLQDVLQRCSRHRAEEVPEENSPKVMWNLGFDGPENKTQVGSPLKARKRRRNYY